MYHHSKDISQPLMFRSLGGQLVGVRQALAADTFLLADLLCRLSEHTRHLRYMRSGSFSAEAIWSEVARMTRGNPLDHTTLVAMVQSNDHDEAIAVAELVRDSHDATVGEIALVVRDDQQRQGIGRFLLWRLIGSAQRSGITSLSASMLAENSAMLRLICGLGLPYMAMTRSGETQMLMRVPPQPEVFASAPYPQKLFA